MQFMQNPLTQIQFLPESRILLSFPTYQNGRKSLRLKMVLESILTSVKGFQRAIFVKSFVFKCFKCSKQKFQHILASRKPKDTCLTNLECQRPGQHADCKFRAQKQPDHMQKYWFHTIWGTNMCFLLIFIFFHYIQLQLASLGCWIT